MSVTTFKQKRNDTWPDVVSVLRDANNKEVDLTGATVKFIMKADDGIVKVDAAATPDADQVSNRGRVTYSWVAGDTDESGRFRQEWEVTFPSGETGTFPKPGYNRVIISDDLA